MSLLRHVACLLLGVAVSLAAVLVHRAAFPWGLLLALGTTFAVAWWLLGSSWPRCAASYVVGWLVLFGLLVAGRPEGDFVYAADVRGYAMIGAALLLLVVGIVSLAGSSRPTSPRRGA